VLVAFERLAADALEAGAFGDFATAERVAARYYWRCWHDLVSHYTAWWAERLAEHWRTAGTRNVAGQLGQSKPRDAVTPVHAAERDLRDRGDDHRARVWPRPRDRVDAHEPQLTNARRRSDGLNGARRLVPVGWA
jgi:hypothetical protein